MAMDIHSMGEARFWHMRSFLVEIAAETFISTRKKYGCCRTTTATKKVRTQKLSDEAREQKSTLFLKLAFFATSAYIYTNI